MALEKRVSSEYRAIQGLGDRRVATRSREEEGSEGLLAFDTLTHILYDELHRIAEREYRRAGSPATMQPTALVSEAYIKLQRHGGWRDQNHFLGSAVTAMRHILIDGARARMTAKRKAERTSITQALDVIAHGSDDAELVRLNDALVALAEVDPRLAKVVECRFFAGLSERETAGVLGVSERTALRWWQQARAWIYAEMADEEA
jgi:RNA polymerase sigma factor (TIGR02999 family)